MKQLTGLDASWLYIETKTCPMHVGSINVFDYPDDNFDPLEATRRQFGSRVGSIEPLRRKLVCDPLQLDHPYWVVDEDFDLDYHIHHVALPRPDSDTLTRHVARLMERPLDRSRALWEAHVIEGLEGGKWALFTMYHHAAIDGGAGILLAGQLYDADPSARAEIPDPMIDDAEESPSTLELISRASRSVLKQPVDMARYQYSTLKHVVAKTRESGVKQLQGVLKDTLKSVVSGPSDQSMYYLPTRSAPATPWNRAVSDRRDFLCHSWSLKEIRALKSAMECSVNDAVLAICAGGLRRYLLEHDALPEEPLVAAIPVSERTGTEEDTWINRISVVLTQLPTQVGDAAGRAAEVKVSTGKVRDLLSVTPEYALGNMAELSTPLVASTLAQLTSKHKLVDRTGSVMNVTVSNVAGPREPLYLAGAKMERTVPVSLLNEGVGLNITVMSYTEHLELGLTACRKLIPDLPLLRDCMLEEMQLLQDTYLASA